MCFAMINEYNDMAQGGSNWLKLKRIQKLMASPKPRGGAHHGTKPAIDDKVLDRIFAEQCRLLMDLGPYEHLSRAQACNGKALVALFDLLLPIVQENASAEVSGAALKLALLRLAAARPGLNKSPYSNFVWAGLRVERLTTVLYHLRRIHREPLRLQQCAAKLTGVETSQLHQLLNHLGGCTTSSASSSQSCAPQLAITFEPDHSSECAKTVFFPDSIVAHEERVVGQHLEQASPATGLQLRSPRTLKKNISEVSVDSEGFPRLTMSCSASSSAKPVCSPSPTPRFLKRPGHRTSPAQVGSDGYPLLVDMDLDVQPNKKLMSQMGFNMQASFTIAIGW